MAGKYLDGDAVLKALYDDDGKERQYEYCSELKERIEHGEFDARPVSRTFTEAYQAGIYTAKKALADKDAEIAGLKEEADKKYVDLVHKYNWLGAQTTHRIADLEKLCDMQKATIETQGKTLREARENILDEVNEAFERVGHYPLYLDDVWPIVNACRPNQPAQKESELFICPTSGTLEKCVICAHRKPHAYDENCHGPMGRCPGCVPVTVPQPSPVPTSGTGTALEGATVEQEQQFDGDLFHPAFVKLIRDSRNCNEKATDSETIITSIPKMYEKTHPFHKDTKLTDFEKTVIRGNIRGFWSWLINTYGFETTHMVEKTGDDLKCPTCGRYSEECDCEGIYPGMAKDIGDLTLRVDALENWHRYHMDTHKLLNNNNQELNLRIGKLEKEVKDQREDYHAHIRQLVEENGKAHKHYDKLLKRKSNP
jgi:hypothetical protein